MKQPTRREVLAGTAVICSTAVALPLCISNAGASEEQPITHNVEIRKFMFVPDHLTVNSGDTIVWTNFDIVPHTATADDESWDTGTLKKGQTKSIVVSETMTEKYFCRFHPHMKAGLNL